MKKEVLLALALANILSIKANATPEEIAKLDVDKFNSNDKEKCVLGQMTGNSESERAKELVGERNIYWNTEKWRQLVADGVRLKESDDWAELLGARPLLNPICLDLLSTTPEDEASYGSSAMECYLLFGGANIEDAFKFLKGEIDTFEPTIEETPVKS